MFSILEIHQVVRKNVMKIDFQHTRLTTVGISAKNKFTILKIYSAFLSRVRMTSCSSNSWNNSFTFSKRTHAKLFIQVTDKVY